jgi:hypothetical protein
MTRFLSVNAHNEIAYEWQRRGLWLVYLETDRDYTLIGRVSKSGKLWAAYRMNGAFMGAHLKRHEAAEELQTAYEVKHG